MTKLHFYNLIDWWCLTFIPRRVSCKKLFAITRCCVGVTFLWFWMSSPPFFIVHNVTQTYVRYTKCRSNKFSSNLDETFLFSWLMQTYFRHYNSDAIWNESRTSMWWLFIVPLVRIYTVYIHTDSYKTPESPENVHISS